MPAMTPVVGRFAPSTTGLLHAGSLVAALASWLDARAAGGRWLVRLEDLDIDRNVPGSGDAIVAQLSRLGLQPDEAPVRQSDRTERYQGALAALLEAGHAFPCGCSRRDVRLAGAVATPNDAGLDVDPTDRELRYPGTCRGGLRGRPVRSWRASTAGATSVAWHDRRLGPQVDDVEGSVGDFVIRRADGPFAYQLAVVVDDAAQGITDVVRGEDLVGNTARQILLQRRLGLPTPRHLHTPLVLAADGQKLSKQTGATPIHGRDPLAALRQAGRTLGLEPDATEAGSVASCLDAMTAAWRERWPLPGDTTTPLA
jgi:glutamyl-Q tRNA(Asp) synthetase